MKDSNPARRTFKAFNAVFLATVVLICALPFAHVLAVSLSSNRAAYSGDVFLLPKEPTASAYVFLAGKREFLNSLLVSFVRVGLGTVISLGLVILAAYPLSKDDKRFRARQAYVWAFAATLFFSGGLIPLFMVIRSLGLINTIWSLVLPCALNVWNIIMLINFFREVPRELEESALLDGAGHFRILTRVYLPVSLPAIATVTLFTVVYHWNAWFDGLVYMNSPDNYPLQSYIYTLINSIALITRRKVTAQDLELLKSVSNKTLLTAQIFLAMAPVMIIYPVLQKYFIRGLTVGGVKE